MSIRLRDLIRNVRACKTAADERATIAKECAAIRTAFKEEENQYRFRNVAKLLYIHMLGYPTHFGQMECLKLIASPKFPEKRIGYLGLMLLLDDRQEVLNLVENSLHNDLNHNNQYIVGLALCSMGNVCNDEMARDLIPDVEKLNRSPNPYIRKKAALVLVRIFRRIPDLIPDYYEKITLPEKGTTHHGMILTTVCLITEICDLNPEMIDYYRQLVPKLVRVLKDLVTPEYSPEYDIAGVTDPFLHCRVLRLLRILGTGNVQASEQMSDVLAQIATNTETLKNPGNAIVYECVQTILAIECESGLRVLAINILGRFLLNRDNNIRYVALNTLVDVVHVDNPAVQRHRTIILDCLKDPDISIRRRALELTYMLVTESNIEPMARELLNYLTVADTEFKEDLTTKLFAVVDRFAQNRRWHIETVLQILVLGGSYVREEVAAASIALISQSSEFAGFTTRRLFSELCKSIQHQAIVQVGVWCLGEFGDHLVAGHGNEGDSLQTPTQDDVVGMLSQVLKSGFSNQTTKQYCISALTKLISRFNCPAGSPLHQTISTLLAPYCSSVQLEMQQRTCEYNVLFQPRFDTIRQGILDVMPPIENSIKFSLGLDEKDPKRAAKAARAATSKPAQTSAATSAPPNAVVTQPVAPAPITSKSDVDFLLDLVSLDTPSNGTAAPATTTSAPPPSSAMSLMSLLDDIPSGPPAQTPASTGGMGMSMGMGMGSMGGLGELGMGGMGGMGMGNMGGMGSMGMAGMGMGGMGGMGGLGMSMGMNPSPASAPMSNPASSNPMMNGSSAAPTTFNAYDKNGLCIEFTLEKTPGAPNQTTVNVKFFNSLPEAIEGLVFQAAVPKYCKVQLNSANGTVVPPNRSGFVTQSMKIINNQFGQSPAKVLMRITFRAHGQEFQDTQPVDLPPGH